jgi:hypothetical protein
VGKSTKAAGFVLLRLHAQSTLSRRCIVLLYMYADRVCLQHVYALFGTLNFLPTLFVWRYKSAKQMPLQTT